MFLWMLCIHGRSESSLIWRGGEGGGVLDNCLNATIVYFSPYFAVLKKFFLECDNPHTTSSNASANTLSATTFVAQLAERRTRFTGL